MAIERTRLTCPDCGGSLEKIEEGRVVQYKCRVGHAYSPQSALAAHHEREENALWTARNLLEEGAELADEIAQHVGEGGKQLREQAKLKRELGKRVQEVVMNLPQFAAPGGISDLEK
jgi:NTP pyrophosphatase (non-canonical NTP hydrolase)